MRTLLPIALVLAACRPDPGEPVYPDRPVWEDTANPTLEGFTPYDPAVPRLSLSVYYDGEATETVVVDGVTNHFYIYDNTFSQRTTDDRIEGSTADVVTVGTVGWWGGGVHWDSPRDLSGYATLHLGLKGTDPSFEALEVGMLGGGVEARLPVADHGFAADGAWHSVSIPLSGLAAAGVDLTSVTVALLMIGTGENPGAELTIDDVYISGGAP